MITQGGLLFIRTSDLGASGCKKCRYDRFAEVLSKANARDNEEKVNFLFICSEYTIFLIRIIIIFSSQIPFQIPEVPHIICDPSKLCKSEEKPEQRPKFIDHTT